MNFWLKLSGYSMLHARYFSIVQKKQFSVKKLFNFIKSKDVEDGTKQKNDHFQSWAEFNNRGYIKPEYMRAWIIEEYGQFEKVLQLETMNTPYHKFETCVDARRTYMYQLVTRPNNVLVKVHASSLNPIDIRICEGYGSKLFNFQRNAVFDRIAAITSWTQSLKEFGEKEFPLVLGRDFSGTVVDVGTKVYDLEIGDEVYGAPGLFKVGTLSDYICVDITELAPRPSTLSHIEAASIPYVALTVTSALRRLVTTPIQPKRALVLGGSGGIGTFAIQYLQAYGFSVTTTCSTNGMSICNQLGADCINYKTEDVDAKVVNDYDKFSIVFDPIGAASANWASRCLVDNGTYVTLKSPLVELTEKYGVILGLSNAYLIKTTKKLNNSNINVNWAYFKPDYQSLLEVSRMIDSGLIKPVVLPENIFSFNDVLKGFKQLAAGHAKGKLVVNVSGLPEVTMKPNINKIIHL